MAISDAARRHLEDARDYNERAQRARRQFTDYMGQKTHEYMNRRFDPVDRFSAEYRAADNPMVRAAAADDQMYTRWAQLASQMAIMEMMATDRHEFRS
jgi:hypothetical protein